MDELEQKLISELKDLCSNPEFIHHKWFFGWHLKIVVRIALELHDFYPQADLNLVKAMSWMHDYGKIIDFDNQYEKTQSEGADFLMELGYDQDFADKAIEYIRILDSKTDIDKAPIEVQIVSSADGCSHVVGPFMYLWWYENYHKDFTDLMDDNYKKLRKDWDRKIVLPEAIEAFKGYYDAVAQQSGHLPEKFIKKK